MMRSSILRVRSLADASVTMVLVCLLAIAVAAASVLAVETAADAGGNVAASPPSPGETFAFTMGRIWWHNDSQLYPYPVGNFDASGVAFGLVAIGGGPMNLTGVSIRLTVRTSNDTELNQPHTFGVYLFEFASPSDLPATLAIPPPLATAKAHRNFTTATWADRAMQTAPLFQIADPTKTYAVWVIKLTEPDFNRALFKPNFCTFVSFVTTRTLPPSQSSSPLRRSIIVAAAARQVDDDVLAPPQRAPPMAGDGEFSGRRIEFFGDSITAGYCNLGKPPGANATTTWAYQSFADTWTYLTAQSLRAALHCQAWSGKGLVENYNNGGVITMSGLALRTCLSTDQFPWKFGNASEPHAHTQPFIPHVVFINLGTNDFWNGTSAALRTRFVAAYKALLSHLAASYAPHLARTTRKRLSVVLACGPMDHSYCDLVDDVRRWAVAALRTQPLVYSLRFATLPLNQTQCGHPDVTGDAAMARIATREIRRIMKWS